MQRDAPYDAPPSADWLKATISRAWDVMLRGIRKASANWLGRIVMGVVMSVLAASFAVWGINDIFRGFGRSTVAKIGGTEIPIEQFRQTYTDAAADAQPAVRPCDHAGRGHGPRRAAAGLERDGRRSRLERARPANAARRVRRRSLAAHRQQSGVPEPATASSTAPGSKTRCATPASTSNASSPSSAT